MLLRLSLFSLFVILAGCGGSSDQTASNGSTDSAPAYGALTLAESSYSVNQNANSLTITVNRTSGSGGAVSISYATADGTAVAGTDYTASNGTLNWADGDAAPKTFAVSVSNTTPFSSTKQFSVTLSDVSGGAAIGTTASAIVTIVGDAGASASTIALSASSYSVGQTAGSLTITVERESGSSGAVSVQYATTDGTAAAGTDYTGANGTLNWADGDTAAKTFAVTVTSTPAFQGSKTFSVTLSNVAGATLATPSTATVTISGSTVGIAGAVSMTAATYSVLQNGGALTITVDRGGGSNGAASVSYQTTDGSAKAGTDYTSASGTLNWASGDAAPKTFTVSISNALPFSGSKSLTIALSAATGATLGSPSSATATITGDAVATGAVALSASTYSIAQNGTALTVSVSRSGGSSGAATVGYATANATAKAGTDYTAASGNLTWAAGDATVKTFSVAISNLTAFSGAKTFVVALASATGAALGSPSSAVATINGDAAATGAVALSASTYSIAQNATALTVSVSRSGGSSGAATVGYATADATAKAGTDYTAASGNLTWAAGDATVKTFSVAISNLTAFSGAKTFVVALASATGAALGSPSSAVATINGDAAAAGALQLSATTYTVLQSAGSLLVTVNRTNGSGGAVSVGYGTADTSAKAGTDYSATSGTLKWAAGDATAKTFTVPISTTTPFSGSKTFAIAISSPAGGATLGTPSNSVATISGSSTTVPAGAMGQAAAARLLSQGTFGATIDTVSAAAAQTYDAWFTSQLAATPSLTYPLVPNDQTNWTEFWMTNAVKGQDQLRQRMAFALSEIFVLSNNSGALTDQNMSMAYYYDMLATNAFGNFRTVLQNVTLNPEMGTYLSTLRNAAGNAALGTHADENYAREVMQLFTIGLVELNIDGSVHTDSSGNPLPTYSQTDVENLARVFTGWASNPTAHPYGAQSWQYDIDYFDPMIAYPSYHDTTAKTILNNTAIASGGTPASDLKTALDTLFNHPNVGPFLAKQLIERLVTSNPSPGYVARVATVFNNNGQGVRGDLSAVAKAILTDPEAIALTGYGKLREPLLRTLHLWRAFNAVDSTGHINEYNVVQNSLATYDESPLQSASVFNFFRPDYEYAGTLTNDGLVVPEFQILNENTLVLADMQNIAEAYDFIDSQGNQHAGYQGYSQVGNLNSSNVMLYTAEWESLAATPASLVNELNLIFMAGQMPTAMQTTLVNYISGIPANTPWSRVAEAAELVVDSPQYSVQR